MEIYPELGYPALPSKGKLQENSSCRSPNTGTP